MSENDSKVEIQHNFSRISTQLREKFYSKLLLIGFFSFPTERTFP